MSSEVIVFVILIFASVLCIFSLVALVLIVNQVKPSLTEKDLQPLQDENGFITTKGPLTYSKVRPLFLRQYEFGKDIFTILEEALHGNFASIVTAFVMFFVIFLIVGIPLLIALFTWNSNREISVFLLFFSFLGFITILRNFAVSLFRYIKK